MTPRDSNSPVRFLAVAGVASTCRAISGAEVSPTSFRSSAGVSIRLVKADDFTSVPAGRSYPRSLDPGPFVQHIEEASLDRSVDEVVRDVVRRVDLAEESDRKSTAGHVVMPAGTPYVAEGVVEEMTDVKTRIARPGAQVYLVGNDAVHGGRTDTLQLEEIIRRLRKDGSFGDLSDKGNETRASHLPIENRVSDPVECLGGEHRVR